MDNFVFKPPSGLIIALQYWQGDETQAMRLARLLADIEPARRGDVALALCRREDTPTSEDAARTYSHCSRKFPMMTVQSRRAGAGHPLGCNELAAGVMDHLSQAWAGGALDAASVFLIEPDGVPVCDDWIDRLVAEHARTLEAGRRVTGCLTDRKHRHINGSLIAQLSLWIDRPSLRRTPMDQAWDLFHAETLLAEARATPLILNPYGSRNWTPGVLESLWRGTAWISNVKDDSAIAWAERALVSRPRFNIADLDP